MIGPSSTFLLLSLCTQLLFLSCNVFEANSDRIDSVGDSSPTPEVVRDFAPDQLSTQSIIPNVAISHYDRLPPVADIVEVVGPAVVGIATQTQTEDFYPLRGSSVQSGTGFFISSEGHVVTNYHVIYGGRKIQVTTHTGHTYDAEVVGSDPGTDLAVLKVEEVTPFSFVSFADPASVRVGEWVIAIGNALGLQGGPTVTVGVVGALDRTLPTGTTLFTDLVQTDAAINEGNSGGPLVNLKGEVIGINTIVVDTAQGIGFSVGTFTAVPVVESILQYGRVVWPWLGVSVGDVTPGVALELGLDDLYGVLVHAVWPDSPAAQAGVETGDLIIQLHEADVPTVRELQSIIRNDLEVGQVVILEIVRGDDLVRTEVALAEMPRR